MYIHVNPIGFPGNNLSINKQPAKMRKDNFIVEFFPTLTVFNKANIKINQSVTVRSGQRVTAR